MAVVKIRNAADDGWIQVGGGVEVVQQATAPTSTYPGQLWLDTDASVTGGSLIYIDSFVSDGTDTSFEFTFDTTYSMHELWFEQVVPATDNDTHYLQVATSTGYINGATSYNYAYTYASSGGPGGAGTQGTGFRFMWSVGSAASEQGFSGFLRFYNLFNTTYYKAATGKASLWTATPTYYDFNLSLNVATTSALVSIKGFWTAGTAYENAKIVLFGVYDGSS